MTLDRWLAQHPYLEPMARLNDQVDREMDGITLGTAGIPNWDSYLEDYVAGVPVLESQAAAIDLGPVENALAVVAAKLATRPVPGVDTTLESPGLKRYLSWRLLSRYLFPVVDAFGGWRQEERWLRHYCPVCGSPPAMAQLIGTDPGSLRMLACGCCGNRWRYRRTGCPFCRTQDDHRLAVIAVEGQAGLRIDYCEQCRGYLKTYQGQGSEIVLLADWTSIHLDMIALDRGLKRMAASVYEVMEPVSKN
jgi:FdhE protein